MRLADLRLRRGDLDRAREHARARRRASATSTARRPSFIDALRARLAVASSATEAAAARAARSTSSRRSPAGFGGRARARPRARHGADEHRPRRAGRRGRRRRRRGARRRLSPRRSRRATCRSWPIAGVAGGAARRRARAGPSTPPSCSARPRCCAAREDAANLEIAALTAELREALGDDAFRAAYARGRGARRATPPWRDWRPRAQTRRR